MNHFEYMGAPLCGEVVSLADVEPVVGLEPTLLSEQDFECSVEDQ